MSIIQKVARSIICILTRLYPIERGKFRLQNLLYSGFFAPNVPAFVNTRLRYNLRMELNTGEFLQSHLYLFGSYELPTVRFIRRLIHNNAVCFDVGAQIGYLTLVMASANPTCKVYSFEPESANAERFLRNVQLNNLQNVTLIRKAISDHPHMIKLFLSADHNSGTHSTVASDPNVGTAFIEVPATTIDEQVKELQVHAIDLIKLDIEGAELEAIQGAQTVLTTLRPTLVIELAETIQQARGFSTVAFKSYMNDFGYSAYSIHSNGALSEVPANIPHVMENVVFVHNERKSHVFSRVPLRA